MIWDADHVSVRPSVQRPRGLGNNMLDPVRTVGVFTFRILEMKRTYGKRTPSKRVFKKPRQQSIAEKIGASNNAGLVPERKEVTASTNLAIASAAATWSTPVLLNGMTYGTGEANNHVGRKVTLKSLAVRYILGPNGAFAAATSVMPPCRMMIYYDHAPSGAAAAITDVLNANSINGHVNLNNKDRFLILYDRIITDEAGYETAFNNAFSIAGKINLKLGGKLGLEQIFNSGNAGTIADINVGSIYIAFCTTGNVNFGTGARVDFSSRIRFTDM